MRTLAALGLALCACTGTTGDTGSGGGGGAATGGGTAAGGGTASGGGAATGGGAAATGGGSATGGGGAGAAAGGGAATGGGGAASGGGAATGGGTALSGCAAHSYALCEDFESTDAGQLPTGWTQLSGWGPGTVEVATDAAHGGTHALKSVTMNPGQPRAETSLGSLGALKGTHWGRVFYRVGTPAPNASSASAYFHITFVGLRASNESRVVDTVESPSGTVQYLYNLPDDSCCNGSSYDYHYDGDWHCAEWWVDHSQNAYRFFVDGSEVTSIGFTGNNNAQLADFSSLALGSIYYVSSNGELDVWLDDLAIDGTQIGCN